MVLQNFWRRLGGGNLDGGKWEKSEIKPKLAPGAGGHGDQSGATPKCPHQVRNRGDPHDRSFVSQPLPTVLAWPEHGPGQERGGDSRAGMEAGYGTRGVSWPGEDLKVLCEGMAVPAQSCGMEHKLCREMKR